MDKRITPRSPRAALEPEHVPVPKQRSKSVRHPLVIAGNAIFTALILLLIVGVAGFIYGKQRFEAPGPLAQDKVVNVPPRLGLLEIVEVLQREGVINEHWSVFVGGVFAMNARSDLKSGEYLFPKQASLHDVIETLVDGKVVQHTLTVPEGLTSEQIVARILDTEFLAGQLRDIPREGTLLPDSYKFPRNTPREQVIQRMQQAQRRAVQDIWDRRLPDVPLRTPEQLVTLASIVEKETGKPEERTRVAAVFANRLKQKMRLQSDPTIIYGIAGGKATLGRPISRSDIDQPTPYNTYVIDGLPPGPIANPGRASLEAAANPARTKELYFVADGTGGHSFAEQYDQHQKNVAKLRALEQSTNSITEGNNGQAGEPADQAVPTAAAPAPKAPIKRSVRPANPAAK